METMVATVLIVVLFMVASLAINSLMAAQIKSDQSEIVEHLNHLEYRLQNNTISFPYYEEWKQWEIEATRQALGEGTVVIINAIHVDTQQEVSSTIGYHGEF